MALFTRRRDSAGDPGEDDFEDFDDFEEIDEPAPAPVNLRPIDMRDWEIPVGYVVAGLIVLVAILELTITTGKGAPANPNRILPVIGIVVGLAQAVTIRYKNRLVTAITGAAGGLIVAYVKVPDALGLLHSIGFLAPFAYALVITQRHSRAQRALNRAQPNQRGSRRATKAAPEPTGPKASRRYTPPKAKEGRNSRRR